MAEETEKEEPKQEPAEEVEPAVEEAVEEEPEPEEQELEEEPEPEPEEEKTEEIPKPEPEKEEPKEEPQEEEEPEEEPKPEPEEEKPQPKPKGKPADAWQAVAEAKAATAGVGGLVQRVKLHARGAPAGQARNRFVDARPLAGDGIDGLALWAYAVRVDPRVQNAVVDVAGVVIVVQGAGFDLGKGAATLRWALGRQHAGVVGGKGRAADTGGKGVERFLGRGCDLGIARGQLVAHGV